MSCLPAPDIQRTDLWKFIRETLLVARSQNGGTLSPFMWEDVAARAWGAWMGVHKPKKARASRTPSTDAERLYALYPLKKSRGLALRTLQKHLEKVGYDQLEEAIQAYAKVTARWPESDRKYLPHCSSWVNAEGYLDDRKTWERPNMRPEPKQETTTPEPEGWLEWMKANYPDWVLFNGVNTPLWATMNKRDRQQVLELYEAFHE